MYYASVVRVLAFLLLIVAAASIPSIFMAIAAGEDSQTFAFGTMILCIVVVSSSVLLLTPKPDRKARPSDALGTVILWWFITPVATSLPFVLGVENDSVLSAIHEATACLTTTGQSVISVQNNEWPISLVVWRGMLHLLGGLATITVAASVLAALNLGGPGIHRTVLFTVPETSFFNAVPRVARVVSILMVISILALFSALVFMGVPAERALGDSVSALTTGLVHPQGIMRAPLDTGPSIVLGIGLLVGAMGLAIWLPLKDRKPLKAVTDPEVTLFVGLLFVFVGFAVASDLNVTEGLSCAGFACLDRRVGAVCSGRSQNCAFHCAGPKGWSGIPSTRISAVGLGISFPGSGIERTKRDRGLGLSDRLRTLDIPAHVRICLSGAGFHPGHTSLYWRSDQFSSRTGELSGGLNWACASIDHFFNDSRAIGGFSPDSSPFPQLLEGVTAVRTCTEAVIPLARHITRTGQIGFPSCPPTKNRICKTPS